MGLIGPERTTVEICPLCELDARDGRHATSRHQNEPTVEVEYVRADLLRGAVDALRGVLPLAESGARLRGQAVHTVAAINEAYRIPNASEGGS